MGASAWSFGADQDTGVRSLRCLEMNRVAHAIATVNTWIQPGENVAIVCDPEVSPMIVEALATQVYVVGGNPVIITIAGQTVHGAELPKPVANALKGADAIYAVVSKSISHTVAVREARMSGVRYLGFSNITEEAFLHGAATADWSVVKKIGDAVKENLRDSADVRVVSRLGTDVTFSLAGRPVSVSNSILPRNAGASADGKHLPDNGRMFPDGEVYCCPLEDSVNGRIVVDRWIQGVGILDAPVTWAFRDGKCVDISGGPQARILVDLLEREGDEYSRRLGEFAVGINPNARFDGNPHREGKKLLGGVHFALGTGTICGGIYQSTLHLDGTLTPPQIYANRKLFFDEGKLIGSTPALSGTRR